MSEEKISLFALDRNTLVSIMRKAGCRTYSEETLDGHIEEGFQLNGDGTVDVFDYATFLCGEKMKNPPPRQPPSTGFNTQSVNPTELAGWLTLYNHLGMEIGRGRIVKMFQSYHYRFQAKDNERNIDFLKFVAFCVTHRPNPRYKASGKTYEEHKAEMNRRNKEASALARDIGELPKVLNPQRKEECEFDFRRFCEEYFPDTFQLAWSEDHIKCIGKIEESVTEGGLFALAMSRGSGKTCLAETAAIWSILYGHRQFISLIGATETAALEMLDSIKTELETNERLDEDFPEVIFPIASLQGIANRCNGQTYKGVRTRITWTSDELVLPTIEGSKASGVIVRVAGITGRIRGMKYKRPDGKTVRPQLVIVDDPQTRESARSLEQNKNRIKILSGDILGLAGPGQKISGIMPCTIIEPGDMADTILDREKHPEWNGEKCKLMYAPPVNTELWDKYAEIRADSLREDGNIEKATEFYVANREKMDEGAVVSWPERFDKDEVSAVQNAMNLMIRDSVAFAAEYQNEPLKDEMSDDSVMSADAIASKLSGIPKNAIPLECTKITAFVDVQKKCLFYSICAWSDEFSGSVVDYGTYPPQNQRRFSLDTVHPTLQEIYPKQSIEGQIYTGLGALFKDLCGRVFIREDGLEMNIDKAAIDANWGISTDIVYQFCRRGEYSQIVMPSHGHYIGASSNPISNYKKKPGEKIGLNWIIPAMAGKRATRHVMFDTNFWKSFVHSRLGVMEGNRGCLSLYGTRPIEHELIAEHLTAEYKVRTSGRGRVVDEWKLRPDRSDNHWLDCVVGCAVLASVLGSSLDENSFETRQKRHVRLSSIMDKKETSELPEFKPVEFNEDNPKTERKRIKLSALMRR